MTLYKGVDASQPGAPLPAGTDILAAYIGVAGEPSSPDTPHIWTGAEWNSYVTFAPGLRLLPVYVHSFPGDPVADANNAADAALALGWAPGIGRLIACDIEMMIDGNYLLGFADQLTERGFNALVYGTAWAANQNPPLSGRWISQLTAKPPNSLPDHTVGCQWRFGAEWDYDVFDQYVYDNCGQGLRVA